MAIADAIAAKLAGRVGNPDVKSNSGNISLIDKGQTRDIAAAKAASTGQSKATTNRAIARAEALGEDTLAKITGQFP